MDRQQLIARKFELIQHNYNIYDNLNKLKSDIYNYKPTSEQKSLIISGWVRYKVELVESKILSIFLEIINVSKEEKDSILQLNREKLNYFKSKTCWYLSMEASIAMNAILNSEYCIKREGIFQKIIDYFKKVEEKSKQIELEKLSERNYNDILELEPFDSMTVE